MLLRCFVLLRGKKGSSMLYPGYLHARRNIRVARDGSLKMVSWKVIIMWQISSGLFRSDSFYCWRRGIGRSEFIEIAECSELEWNGSGTSCFSGLVVEALPRREEDAIQEKRGQVFQGTWTFPRLGSLSELPLSHFIFRPLASYKSHSFASPNLKYSTKKRQRIRFEDRNFYFYVFGFWDFTCNPFFYLFRTGF